MTSSSNPACSFDTKTTKLLERSRWPLKPPCLQAFVCQRAWLSPCRRDSCMIRAQSYPLSHTAGNIGIRAARCIVFWDLDNIGPKKIRTEQSCEALKVHNNSPTDMHWNSRLSKFFKNKTAPVQLLTGVFTMAGCYSIGCWNGRDTPADSSRRLHPSIRHRIDIKIERYFNFEKGAKRSNGASRKPQVPATIWLCLLHTRPVLSE